MLFSIPDVGDRSQCYVIFLQPHHKIYRASLPNVKMQVLGLFMIRFMHHIWLECSMGCTAAEKDDTNCNFTGHYWPFLIFAILNFWGS